MILKRIFYILGLILFIVLATYLIFFNDQRAATPASVQQPQTKDTDTEPSFNKQQFSTVDPDSPWVVVNKVRPLTPLDYAPQDLEAVGNNQQMRAAAAQALMSMIDDAQRTDDLNIKPLSGYRSYDRQVGVYDREVTQYGQAVADTESARPGFSEHQTGWAVDVGGGGCGIEDCFGDTPEGTWVAANAYKYGFIVRYTTDKVAITGYRAEPWHIRYIGKDLATEMHDKNIKTLEEFFGLSAAPNYIN